MKINVDSTLPGGFPQPQQHICKSPYTLHPNIISKRKSQSDVVNAGSRLTPETGIHGGDPRSKNDTVGTLEVEFMVGTLGVKMTRWGPSKSNSWWGPSE